MSNSSSFSGVPHFIRVSYGCIQAAFVFHFQFPDVPRYLQMVRCNYRFWIGPLFNPRNKPETFLLMLSASIKRRLSIGPSLLRWGRKKDHARSYFLKAISNSLAKEEIITYMESKVASPQDAFDLYTKLVIIMEVAEHPLSERLLLEQEVPGTGETEREVAEAPTEPGETGVYEKEEPDTWEKPDKAEAAGFYARTYIIATNLYFELRGEEAEYGSLIRRPADLEKFIREQFKAQKIPSTLAKRKGYSYKRILEGHKSANKGQLKPLFRQIIDHPEVFGEDISAHAAWIFNQHLRQ